MGIWAHNELLIAATTTGKKNCAIENLLAVFSNATKAGSHLQRLG